MPWDRIILAVERVKGEKWKEFRDRYGDWGRDPALWLGRLAGGSKLAELGLPRERALGTARLDGFVLL